MKRRRTKIIIAAVIGIVFLVSVFCYANPKIRTSLFVHAYHDLIEEGLAAGNGVPADDAVIFDNSDYDVEGSVDKVIEIIKSKVEI